MKAPPLRTLLLAFLPFLLAPGRAVAQKQHTRGRGGSQQQHTFGFYVGGGGTTTIKDLNGAGTEFMNGGLYLAGGVNWEPMPGQPNLAFQGDLLWTKQQLHTPKVGSGTNLDLFFFGINMQYTFLNSGQFGLSVHGGGGIVAMRVADLTGATELRPFIRLGFRVDDQLGPKVGIFAQGFGLLYEISGFPTTSVLGPYRKRQSAVGIGAGLALAL